jgi:hypothetical protein
MKPSRVVVSFIIVGRASRHKRIPFQQRLVVRYGLHLTQKKDRKTSNKKTTSFIMPIGFERIVGPKRDVHELEFISALLQTDLRTIRLDGSIKAYDIVQYLKSRYGVDASVETVRRWIVCDLAASTESDEHLCKQLSNNKQNKEQEKDVDDDDGEEIVMDICQFASLMLAPELLEAKINGSSSNNNNELGAKLFGSGILDHMLSQAHGGVDDNAYDENSNQLTWTHMALRHLFNRYNELDVSDELIDEMIQVAEGTSDHHDAGNNGVGGTARECIIRALTSDLGKFDINWKNKFSINYYDALGDKEEENNNEVVVAENEYGDDDYNKSNMMIMSKDPENVVMTSQSIRRTATQDTSGTEEEPYTNGQQQTNKTKRRQKEEHPLMRSYTAPNIDFYADTHRRPFYVTAIWVCCVTLYFAYVWGAGAAEEVVQEDGTTTMESWSTVKNCTERYSELACPILNGITGFLAVFIQLTVLGVPFIFLGTLGASVYVQHWLGTVARLLVGMITIIIMAIMPFYRVSGAVPIESDDSVHVCNKKLVQ